MKKLLFIFIVLLNFKAFTQDLKLHGSYRFTRNELGWITEQQEVEDTSKISNVHTNHKITFMGLDTTKNVNMVYYCYWGFEAGGSDTTKNEENVQGKMSRKAAKQKRQAKWADTYNEKTFSMPYKKFVDITSPVYRLYKGCEVGVYTIPFRIRGTGRDFDFESSLSLQSNIVFGFGTHKNPESWFDLSGGIGLTGVNLNSKNSEVTEERTATAFTASIGGVFKINRWANMGLFLGYDWLGAKDREVNWKYNGDLWIGLGINISFNSIKTDDNTFIRQKKQ